MMVQRGEIWLADLNPTRGSEQAGTRPVLVFQNDVVSKFTTTILAIPLTTNLRRASVPSCLRVSKNEGGLTSDSVLLCHQLRVVDKMQLQRKLGSIGQQTLAEVDACVMFTMGIS